MLPALISCVLCAAGSDLPLGPWRAALASPGGELPFELEIASAADEPGGLRVVIRNGPEEIAVPRATWSDGRLVLDLEHYDARVEATWDADAGRLAGTWTKRRGPERWAELAFTAQPGSHPRFASLSDCAAAQELPGQDLPGPELPIIDGRWRVDFSSDEDVAVGVFAAAPDGTASGTFLTTLGDYRFLAGAWCGDQLELSCFDGAHAFLFRARLAQDGTLLGDFWSADSWHETWTAVRDPDVALPDPFEAVRWSSEQSVDELVFTDLAGRPSGPGDEAYRGRVRLVQLFGTWCPNCHDEARYLVELSERFGPRGLQILGVAFEHTGDRERDARQVRRFAERHGARWPILLGGLSDKAAATTAVGALDRLRAYPTTLFVDAEGRVRAVHSGFAGPATGPEHERLRERFETRIEELLAEAARAPR